MGLMLGAIYADIEAENLSAFAMVGIEMPVIQINCFTAVLVPRSPILPFGERARTIYNHAILHDHALSGYDFLVPHRFPTYFCDVHLHYAAMVAFLPIDVLGMSHWVLHDGRSALCALLLQ